MSYRLGVDVGGTNTDAVLLNDKLELIASVKVPTTKEVSTGIFEAIRLVLQKVDINKDDIKHAMLGTTQCTNAIVERKRLCKVGIIRIGRPATLSIEPMADWPEDLKKVVSENFFIIKGGYEFDGKEISQLDIEEVKGVARKLKGKVDSIAITCVFSPVRSDHERQVAAILGEELGEDIFISLSNKVSSMGLLERENSVILNAALMKVAKATAEGFKKGLKEAGIRKAEIYLCQNDGTLMSIEYAQKYPILTVACGPTNSIRGASFLSNKDNSIVVDIGGTTTDIGIIVNRFPRESLLAADIGGVRTNFRMPDIISIGLGGGSIIRELDGEVKIGPDSVGYRLTKEALVFGGETLTATDIAVRLGFVKIGDPSKVKQIEEEFAKRVYKKMIAIIASGIDKMKLSAKSVPVVLVGGGGILIADSSDIEGVSNIIKPNNYPVANAIGASIAQASGMFERVFVLEGITRDDAIKIAKDTAVNEAIAAGANPSAVEIVDIEDVPLAYHPGNATRIKVKAAGDLKGI